MTNRIFEEFPLMDANDHEILMHREAHFGSQFPVMIDYYKSEGKGIQPNFTLKRLEELAALEAELKLDLAIHYLDTSEAERVGESRTAYKALRSVYEVIKPKSAHPRLIADLILSEDPEAEEEIKAIVAEKGAIVPSLIELLRSEHFYDPLFPGYGQAPMHAVKCLELIGDKRALIALFEAFGQGDFFEDEQIIKALQAIGEPAKQFLLKVVQGHPINDDNEKAAIALIQFKDDPEIAAICLKLLKDSEVQRDLCLPTYLVLVCEGLKDKLLQEEFIALSKQESLSSSLKEDMKAVIHAWKES